MGPSNISPQPGSERRNWLVAGLAILVLAIFLEVYSHRSNAFSPAKPGSAFSSTVTNPGVLKYWMSPDVYKYTLAQINDYLSQNNHQGSQLTIVNDKISPGLYGTLSFDLLVEPVGTIYKVVEATKDIAGVQSYSVLIDGHPQNSVPLSNSNGTSFSGIQNLVNRGLSAPQANELQKLLLDFDSSAGLIVVGSNIIVNGPDSDGLSTATFTVNIDKKGYSAQIKYSGLESVELMLKDSSGKRVYDSGMPSSSG